MKLVYIAGPISKGDLAANINQGTAAFLALTKAGIASICPMWSAFSGEAMTASPAPYSAVVSLAAGGRPVNIAGKAFAVADANHGLTHAEWLAVDFEYIRRCDALLRLPGESVGAEMEIAEANRIGIPVFHSLETCIAWANN